MHVWLWVIYFQCLLSRGNMQFSTIVTDSLVLLSELNKKKHIFISTKLLSTAWSLSSQSLWYLCGFPPVQQNFKSHSSFVFKLDLKIERKTVEHNREIPFHLKPFKESKMRYYVCIQQKGSIAYLRCMYLVTDIQTHISHFNPLQTHSHLNEKLIKCRNTSFCTALSAFTKHNRLLLRKFFFCCETT